MSNKMKESKWQTEPSVTHSGWRTSFHVKDLLGDEDSPAVTAMAARTLHERLEKYRIEAFNGMWAEDDEIEQISDEFHTIGFVDGDENADAGHFNVVLDGLYDWADDQRVLIR
jgi:uncharacterized protein (DUF1786 family)